MADSAVRFEVVNESKNAAGIGYVADCISDLLRKPRDKIFTDVRERVEQGREFLVLLANEKPVGYSEFTVKPKEHQLFEHDFLVRPKFQKLGFGTMLLNKLVWLSRMRHCTHIRKVVQQPHEMSFAERAQKKLPLVDIEVNIPKREVTIHLPKYPIRKPRPRPKRPSL